MYTLASAPGMVLDWDRNGSTRRADAAWRRNGTATRCRSSVPRAARAPCRTDRAVAPPDASVPRSNDVTPSQSRARPDVSTPNLLKRVMRACPHAADAGPVTPGCPRPIGTRTRVPSTLWRTCLGGYRDSEITDGDLWSLPQSPPHTIEPRHATLHDKLQP